MGNHGHEHDHSSVNRRRLVIALSITATIMIAEVIGSIVTGSLSLLVDAGHMLTDTLGLSVALLTAQLMTRPATSRRTWGWKRMEVLGAAVQAAILLVVGTVAVVEGVQRFFTPPEVGAEGMLIIGAVGLLGNIVALLVLAGGRDSNLNLRAAFFEVGADALGSVAVLVSAGVIALTGWMQMDAVAGLLVAALIIPRAVLLLRRTGSILLETAPEGLDLDEVRAHLVALPHVVDVHDLHASEVGTGLPVLTAHVVLEDECFRDGHSLELLEQMQNCIATHHDVAVEHSTFQLESEAFRNAHEQQLRDYH